MACVSVAICVLGIVAIRSADLRSPEAGGEWTKQAFYLIGGVVVMVLFTLFDYQRFERFAIGLYVANLALLGFVMRGGHSALGAVRWISLGPLGTFQPSEPAKLILAICAASLLARKSTAGPREMVLALGMVGVPALLILKQPDLGTALVVFAILSTQLFFAVTNLRYFNLYAVGVAALAAFAVGTNVILKPFQKSRLLVFMHPDADLQGAGYNLNQSKIAVGSGELIGKGLFHGTQTQLQFVPEHSRDFIFTVVGEELGYFGTIGLLAAYAFLLVRGFRAVVSTRDRFGLLLGVGLIAMLAFHIVVNVGMTVGIMPIAGIPLPFMSYGGSAILTNFAAVGILLNMAMQGERLVFDDPPPRPLVRVSDPERLRRRSDS